MMAFDDMTALGGVRALSKAGIKVPEQCSVIGFDDVAHSSLLTPALTTVRQPMAEMGKMAVTICLRRHYRGAGKNQDRRAAPQAHAGAGGSRFYLQD